MSVATQIAHLMERGGFWVWLGVGAGLFVASLLGAAAAIASWPADRFLPPSLREPTEVRYPARRLLLAVVRNLAGVLLIAVGVVMSLPGVPGQGLLTMLIGVTLVDFPGKVRVERALVSRPLLRRGIDRLRARLGRPPLRFDWPEPAAPPPHNRSR